MNRPWSWYAREIATIAALIGCITLLFKWIGL